MSARWISLVFLALTTALVLAMLGKAWLAR